MIQESGIRSQESGVLLRCGRVFNECTAMRQHLGFLSFAFCLLMPVSLPNAEELVDPMRPPASIAAPVAASGVAERQPAVLQSIIISTNRRAAIIGGETVELGGKYGDAKLVEVNEGGVVLQSAQGRQVMTLFPDVKVSGRQEAKMKPQSPAGRMQSGKRSGKPVAHEEKK